MTTISEETERIEQQTLAAHAQLAMDSKGRERPEERDPLRTCFQRDRDRIVHSKAFRRLKHKTQVFFAPAGDHYRVRLTHTLEVSQVARTIARALRLNEDLTEAIALGHDLGHTPFGHVGEGVLTRLLGRQFRHSEQSLRIVDVLEKLNLSWEVRDGILGHPWAQPDPATLEARCVRFADRIAYLNHDLDDAVRYGIFKDVPGEFSDLLGGTHSDRINSLVVSVVEASRGTPQVTMGEREAKAMAGLRDYMFEHLYMAPEFAGQRAQAERVVEDLFAYYSKHPEEMPAEYIGDLRQDRRKSPMASASSGRLTRPSSSKYSQIPDDVPTRVADFVSGMTDRYATQRHEEITE